MAFKITSFSHLACFFFLNLLFFTFVNSTCKCPIQSTTCSYPSQPASSQSSNYNYGNPKSVPPPLTPYQPISNDEKCPRDALKIGICAKLLNNGLLEAILWKPPITACCSLVEGLADLEVAVCLCTVLKASVLGIDPPNIPISLNLLSGNCGREIPISFQCS
ncbi:unnamed protein product [Citrullus colocynthis]|uniref:Bifunctional inhibitor/plant lipid transfer protein/seed storage helical domain-containing protein n=1 Tax=Citrullus colocynthis TaxID=252529 RepID=A0ABP0XWJ5_9ROSI